MIKKILMGLGVVLGTFVVIAALKPADYVISRDVTINAKSEAIYPFLANAKNADSWMPWKEMDSKVQMTYSGPSDGVGSISSWESTGDMGAGIAEVIEVVQNKSVKTKITYTKPMEMSQVSEFTLTPQGENTLMTWSVNGRQPFFARLMCTIMFINMDKYVGGMFEKGLGNLKSMVETQK